MELNEFFFNEVEQHVLGRWGPSSREEKSKIQEKEEIAGELSLRRQRWGKLLIILRGCP